MIKVKDSIEKLWFPTIPGSLGQLSIVSTVELSQEIFNAFASAIKLIDNALDAQPVPLSWLKASMVIYDRDVLTLEFPGLKNAGYHANIMFMPVHVWQALHLNTDQMVVCILEEMCHCFWRIIDEDAVKDKVLEVVRLLNPDIRLEHLYPNLFVDGKRISAYEF